VLAPLPVLGDSYNMSEAPPKVPTSYVPLDQQPIQRIVGKRVSPPPGTIPSPEARAAMTANARYLTRAPKGIFFYNNHDEMIRDRERWTIDAILARHSGRA
jgi:hypothetical protein